MRFNRNDENYVYGFVGKNIKKYRKMRNLTQDELAEIVNYSPSFIANIESSTHQTFSLGALWRIATALGVGLHEICYDSNNLGNKDNLKSTLYTCKKCGNTIDFPREIIDVFEFIYAIGKNKDLYPTFTCPKCDGKLIPQNINDFCKKWQISRFFYVNMFLKGKKKHIMNDLELYNEIGKNIQKRRKELHLTQEKLSEITNYSLSFIANIESRTYQSFSISALNNIAKALNTNMINLLPKYSLDDIKSKNIKCEYCNYEMEIPKELNKILANIHDLTKGKIKLTCPKCNKKIIA